MMSHASRSSTYQSDERTVPRVARTMEFSAAFDCLIALDWNRLDQVARTLLNTVAVDSILSENVVVDSSSRDTKGRFPIETNSESSNS